MACGNEDGNIRSHQRSPYPLSSPPSLVFSKLAFGAAQPCLAFLHIHSHCARGFFLGSLLRSQLPKLPHSCPVPADGARRHNRRRRGSAGQLPAEPQRSHEQQRQRPWRRFFGFGSVRLCFRQVQVRRRHVQEIFLQKGRDGVCSSCGHAGRDDGNGRG